MRYVNLPFALLILILINSSCKKEKVKFVPLASFNVTNVIINGTTVRLGSNQNDTISNMSFKQIALLPNNADMYIWPTGDSTHPYFDKTIQINDGDSYSLFLAGNVASRIDTLLIKESIPYRTDSTAGIRFINLSPNSPALNITLSSTPTVNEVGNLLYKQITDFKTYPASSSNGNYVFQIRKASDNSLLTSFTLPVPRFANVTLVIKGLVGGSPTIGVLRVNNDR